MLRCSAANSGKTVARWFTCSMRWRLLQSGTKKKRRSCSFLCLTSVWQNWHMLWIEFHSRVYWYDLITLQDLRVKTVHFRLNYMMYLIIATDQKSVSHYILTSCSSNFFSRHLYFLFFQQIKSANVQSPTTAAKCCVLKLFMSI